MSGQVRVLRDVVKHGEQPGFARWRESPCFKASLKTWDLPKCGVRRESPCFKTSLKTLGLQKFSVRRELPRFKDSPLRHLDSGVVAKQLPNQET